MSETPRWDYSKDFDINTAEGNAKATVSKYVNKDGTTSIDSDKEAAVAFEAASAEKFARSRQKGESDQFYNEVSDEAMKTAIGRTETTGYLGRLDSAMRKTDESQAIEAFLEAWREKQALDKAYDEIQSDADKVKIEELREQLS